MTEQALLNAYEQLELACIEPLKSFSKSLESIVQKIKASDEFTEVCRECRRVAQEGNRG